MSSALYYSHPACLQHDPTVHSPGHPAVPELLEHVVRPAASAALPGGLRPAAATVAKSAVP